MARMLMFTLILTLLPVFVFPSRYNGYNCYTREKKEYRTIDGTCNNLDKPGLGKVNTHFRRMMAPQYEYGRDPIGWNKNYHLYAGGYPKPSGRHVVREVVTSTNQHFETDLVRNDFWVSWGQLLAHDLDLTPGSADGKDRNTMRRCSHYCRNDRNCFPIQVPYGDERVRGRCFGFFRSHREHMYNNQYGYVEDQVNNITHWMDANIIYGSYDSRYRAIRDFSSYSGQLKKGWEVAPGKHMMPYDRDGMMNCMRNMKTGRTPDCYLAGDRRANIQVALSSMHVLWFREHNRVASKLRWINPHWKAEKVFQEAKKIVTAEWQHINYDEYLPLLLGKKTYAKLGPYKGYKPWIDPRPTTVFATAAFRLHVAINPIVNRLDKHLREVPERHLNLSDTFFNPDLLHKGGGIDAIIRGMIFAPAKAIELEDLVTEEVTDKLFKDAMMTARDLASMNIQRGRDHGLPSYYAWRKDIGLPTPKTCKGLEDLGVMDAQICERLNKYYGHQGNVDIWLAGVCENMKGDDTFGETFNAILLDTFQHVRDGDRFWYENKQFTKKQLAEIKKATAARIICDNANDIDEMVPQAFRWHQMPHRSKPYPISCKRIRRVNLEAWREYPVWRY